MWLTSSPTYYIKVKVIPYTFVRRGVPVRENTYAGPLACEVGWPVPFLAAFFPPVLPPGAICCWVNSERAFSLGIESGSNRGPTAWEACALTTMLPRLRTIYDVNNNALNDSNDAVLWTYHYQALL